tara:strand:- start:452 stop:928 length:477 start_codon:yes stop_codon:yes gene_type:complete
MTVIRPNSVSGIVSITALGNTLDFYESDGDKLTIGANISGDIIADQGTFNNISVAGTITYDDVTSVDSIGIITARGDVHLVGTASSLGIRTDQPTVALDASQATDAFALPQGTTAQRPTGSAPYIRKNTTNNALEYYDGTEWVEIITDYFPTGSTIFG